MVISGLRFAEPGAKGRRRIGDFYLGGILEVEELWLMYLTRLITPECPIYVHLI